MAKYKAYPEYRDSGVEWLGEIPSHWHLKRLGTQFVERKEKVSDKDYPPLSVTKHGIVPQLETAAKTEAGDNRKLVLKNDFVINSRSDRKGSSGISKLDGSVSLISIVLCPQNILPLYAHHLLRSCYFQEEFYRFGKGIVADLWSTNYSEMKNILIPLPSEKECTLITMFIDKKLNKINTLIEKQEQFIELLKEKRQAVISHAVTKGLNPDMPMKDSGIEWLGDVPCHWNVVKLKYISTLNNQTLPDSTSKHFLIKYIDIGNVSKENGISNPEEMFFSEAPSRARRIVKDGDVIISTVRTYLEAIAIILNPPHNLVVSTGFAVIHPQKLSKKFSLYSFKDRKFIQKIISMSVGISYPAINASDLITIKIPFPEYLEQDEIGDFLHRKTAKIDTLIQKQLQQIELLKERRTALISAAVTGKIDLRDWTPPASSAEASLTAEETTA